jgi:hypothetical protein
MGVREQDVGTPSGSNRLGKSRWIPLDERLLLIAVCAILVGLLPVLGVLDWKKERTGQGGGGVARGASFVRRAAPPKREFAELRELTRSYSASPHVAARLLRLIDLAAHAEAQGNYELSERLLDRYVAVVEKVSGPLLPPDHAEALIGLARGL